VTVKEYEDKMLSLPIAGKVSGEDVEHAPGDDGFFQPVFQFELLTDRCFCDRCRVIRVKRRRAFLFPRRKCTFCGGLHTSIYLTCEACRNLGEQK
jgi:hypothetical protein